MESTMLDDWISDLTLGILSLYVHSGNRPRQPPIGTWIHKRILKCHFHVLE